MSASIEGGSGVEKGLPPLPTMLEALAIHSKSLRVGEEAQAGTPSSSVKSKRSKSRRKMKDLGDDHALPPTLSTDITPPYSSQGSPATPTPSRGAPFTPVSLDSTRLFAVGYDPKNPFGSAYPPSSPAVSRHSVSTTTTPKSSNKFSFGTKSSTKSTAPSVHSSHTMPDMVSYNDVDQWGAPRTPASPSRKVSDKDGGGSGSELRRKNSSSKLLASGLSRSLTRMGSVMKRSTSDNALNSSVSSRKEKWMKKRSRQSTVAEEMGEGWERVDMGREVTEGDTSITRPFNVEHDLHVSPDLGDLPPAWLEALKAQGLSEADLLLIAAARHKASQRPLLRIVKGSDPTADELSTSASIHPHYTRGMSTPAYLVDAGETRGKPLLDKRFSWEQNGPSTPTTPAAATGDDSSPAEQPVSPFKAFRQSLQDSPVCAQTPTRSTSPLDGSDDDRPRPEEETPRRAKRWSDQLRGFQSTFSTFGTDDDWGSQLTLALGGEGGLQTVQEVGSGRGESMETTRSDLSPSLMEADENKHHRASPPALNQSTPRSSRRNPKSLSINSATPTKLAGSVPPLSPRTPGGTRIMRKPMPSGDTSVARPGPRRKSSSVVSSVPSSPAGRPWPHSPPPPHRKEKPSTPRTRDSPSRETALPTSTTVSSLPSSYPHSHSHSHTQSVTQSTESEMEQDVRTPSTNQHFFHSPSSSLSHPMLPRSISEESQFTTLALGRNQLVIPHPDGETGLSAFSFPSKSPPRPNPRYSVPASAGYTESSPPSRGPTPSCGESESEDHHPYNDVPPVPSVTDRIPPSTPPRAKRSSSRRFKGSPPSEIRIDPMSRLDGASTMAERASIALSLISAETDPRSSMASSARSSYVNEVKVLRAFTRDLSGVEEASSERETTSASSETHSTSDCQHDFDSQAAVEVSTSSRPISRKSSPSSRSSRRQGPSPRRSPPAPSPIRPHPFASRKDSMASYETDDDPLNALEAAARQIAKRTEAFQDLSRSHQRRESGPGRYSDADE